MLDQVLQLFGTTPDISLSVMVAGQSLSHITAAVLERIQPFYQEVKPSLVVVQGDTTTSFAASLAAFYQGIKVAHVEAGLRTFDNQMPFPEELNRAFIAKMGAYHFAPTPLNVQHLLREGIASDAVYCVGNTVVDALAHVQHLLAGGVVNVSDQLLALAQRALAERKKIALVTTHRRESFGEGIKNILTAVKILAKKYPDHYFVLPMHLNPVVRKAIDLVGLTTTPGIVCLEPLAYHDLVFILNHASWVMTDSGGIQEEAACLGKKVVVMREKTERVELLWSDMGLLSGTTTEGILAAADKIMQQPISSRAQLSQQYIYGNGHASSAIASVIEKHLNT
jgi:UDP-N-acetylglucosamine 2-epimerase (non-hydrolysing)